jgi:hypothetical protein
LNSKEGENDAKNKSRALFLFSLRNGSRKAEFFLYIFFVASLRNIELLLIVLIDAPSLHKVCVL